MSGPSTYVPQTGFARWLDTRLPILRFAHDTMITFPTPRNLNIWYAFGAHPDLLPRRPDRHRHRAGDALRAERRPRLRFRRTHHARRELRLADALLHANGASMFFLAVYIHMFRGLYYGSYKAPREVLWILGVSSIS